MKKLILLSFVLLLLSCNNENSGDCFQTAGKIIQQEVEVAPFEQITVHKNVELIVKQGPVQKIVIESGTNLMNDIEAVVVNNELILKDYNNCNFFRDYGITKVYVTSPNLHTIRNASQLNISSEGTLTYPSLYLQSTGEKSTFLSVGDYHLTVDNNSVVILSNGISNFYINGKTDDLTLLFSDGDTRFEGQNLIAKNVVISHVSSNDILINPTQSLSGTIHSVGNVISYNKPPVVTLEALSKGKLIFK